MNQLIKKYTYLILLAGPIGILLGLSSCTKDKGNYNYAKVNTVNFENIDTVAGYQVNLGEALKISPKLSTSLDKGMTGSYSYEWKVRNGIYGNNAPDYEEKVLSTTKDLNYVINFRPGDYSISLSVKDNATGISWLQWMKVKVITPYYEGWLVLNNVNDTTRLDFLSYLNNKFTFNENILSILNPGMTTQGKPFDILYYANTLYPLSAGIYLSTASGTYNLDVENYRLAEPGNVISKMQGPPPTGFVAEKMVYSISSGSTFYDGLMMYSKGNFYKQSNGIFFYGTPLNTSSVTGQRFNVSPYSTISGANLQERIVLFNTDEKKFYTLIRQGAGVYSTATPVDPSLGFPEGKDVIYMEDNDVSPVIGTNAAYAILKDPATGKFQMFRYSHKNNLLQAQDYLEDINATDFALAEKYAMSPDLGYLFYSVGGKVYEYDLFLKTAKLMLDKGTDKISLLVFDHSRKPVQWKNALMVGSYSPAGTPGKNGTLTQYTVPPVNGALVELNKWSGMGQIVSISYRSR